MKMDKKLLASRGFALTPLRGSASKPRRGSAPDSVMLVAGVSYYADCIPA